MHSYFSVPACCEFPQIQFYGNFINKFTVCLSLVIPSLLGFAANAPSSKKMICPIHTITKTIITCNGFINGIINRSAQNITEIELPITLYLFNIHGSVHRSMIQ